MGAAGRVADERRLARCAARQSRARSSISNSSPSRHRWYDVAFGRRRRHRSDVGPAARPGEHAAHVGGERPEGVSVGAVVDRVARQAGGPVRSEGGVLAGDRRIVRSPLDAVDLVVVATTSSRARRQRRGARCRGRGRWGGRGRGRPGGVAEIVGSARGERHDHQTDYCHSMSPHHRSSRSYSCFVESPSAPVIPPDGRRPPAPPQSGKLRNSF